MLPKNNVHCSKLSRSTFIPVAILQNSIDHNWQTYVGLIKWYVFPLSHDILATLKCSPKIERKFSQLNRHKFSEIKKVVRSRSESAEFSSFIMEIKIMMYC